MGKMYEVKKIFKDTIHLAEVYYPEIGMEKIRQRLSNLRKQGVNVDSPEFKMGFLFAMNCQEDKEFLKTEKKYKDRIDYLGDIFISEDSNGLIN